MGQTGKMLPGHSLPRHPRPDPAPRTAKRPRRRAQYKLLHPHQTIRITPGQKYKGHAVGTINNSGWKTARKKAGLSQVRVHDLKHTFGRRLRAANAPQETRKLLLGHASGDITTHYSAAEIKELVDATEKIVDRGVAQTPTLTIISRTRENVGKVSEMKKGLAAYNR